MERDAKGGGEGERGQEISSHGVREISLKGRAGYGKGKRSFWGWVGVKSGLKGKVTS